MYCLDLACASNRAQSGGKATNLARAIALGMPVPRGFVITRQALAVFLEGSGLQSRVQAWFESAALHPPDRLKAAYQEICAAALAAPLPASLEAEITTRAGKLLELSPTGLAVRSSGTCEDLQKASFAGVYQSFICVSSLEALTDSHVHRPDVMLDNCCISTIL